MMSKTVVAIFMNVVVLSQLCNAWDNVSVFEVSMTNALNNKMLLTSADFTNELRAHAGIPICHETAVTAGLILCESQIALYNDTMERSYLQEAMNLASNLCVNTFGETNAWYYWQSRMQWFSTCAHANDMNKAYSIASETFHQVEVSGYNDSSNIVSRALLKRKKADGLTIAQAVRLSKALSAAVLGNAVEATALKGDLSSSFQEMIDQIIFQSRK